MLATSSPDVHLQGDEPQYGVTTGTGGTAATDGTGTGATSGATDGTGTTAATGSGTDTGAATDATGTGSGTDATGSGTESGTGTGTGSGTGSGTGITATSAYDEGTAFVSNEVTGYTDGYYDGGDGCGGEDDEDGCSDDEDPGCWDDEENNSDNFCQISRRGRDRVAIALLLVLLARPRRPR